MNILMKPPSVSMTSWILRWRWCPLVCPRTRPQGGLQGVLYWWDAVDNLLPSEPPEL